MNKTDNKFVQDNLGLVHSLAGRFKGRGIEYEELFAAGCEGLVKAGLGFDESRGLKFSTYAVPVILGEIKRLFRDGGSVKVSRSLKELSLKAAAVQEKLRSGGNEPKLSDIASELGVTLEQAGEAVWRRCLRYPLLRENRRTRKTAGRRIYPYRRSRPLLLKE